MRMWMVDPKILCKNHLLGEHGEIHKFFKQFVKKYNMNGRAGQIEPKSMKQRHDELVNEMINRGYNHNSPYSQPDVDYLNHMCSVDKDKSLELLLDRCEHCSERLRRMNENSIGRR
ncbi:MAG TPA: pyrimidine dimer DNA glycosylase/endonuclease V [Patescibacteria group bacterium]|nr:pyrimidine dimer DNA glycosylase/endonuclease V [Patescibacteria group bacterium]